MTITVYCSQRKCKYNQVWRCTKKIIHLKYQEDDSYQIMGQFICKEENEEIELTDEDSMIQSEHNCNKNRFTD